MTNIDHRLAQALWKIYRRPDRPEPWSLGGNLPWNDPAFSERMLREHLDESHGAASRTTTERITHIDWMWQKLALKPGGRLLDVTCGPGLYAVEFAHRGCAVTGVDFSPASIAHARDLARAEGVADACTFVEQDVRQMDYSGQNFDAAMFIYGQFTVFERSEAQALLKQIAQSLKTGGRVCFELLDPAHIDKKDSTWWFTDETRLWGDEPFLHLGERFWHAEEAMSIERFQTIHLETGQMDEVILCDQSYSSQEMTDMLKQAGFSAVEVFPAWDGLVSYDATEWLIYIAKK